LNGRWKISSAAAVLAGSLSLLGGCNSAPPAAPPQAMPVQVTPVTMDPVAQSDTYVATIKSRRSATLQPQVSGNITRILVKSGDMVRAGQVLMTIDPLQQMATVQQMQGTQSQKSAVYDFNKIEVERQRKLYAEGITSKDALDNAEQAYANSRGDYNSSVGQAQSAKETLAYYNIRAPFAGIVGDIPVHVGDFVQPDTFSLTGPVALTTVDEIADLEAYIEIPTERAMQIRMGLPVEILGDDGNVLVRATVDFISPQVDNGLQAVLVKASIPHNTKQVLRTSQLVKARIVWSTSPTPTVPVLAVTRIGGQAFVYVAQSNGKGGFICKQVPVTLGDTIGNTYPVLSGLSSGDKVIVSGIQFLADGVPVQPMG
jgi:RND family efflux transporter MFP subunit